MILNAVTFVVSVVSVRLEIADHQEDARTTATAEVDAVEMVVVFTEKTVVLSVHRTQTVVVDVV